MRDIDAIPVRYKGNEFASMLEFQWARFWDYLNVQYIYEPFNKEGSEQRTFPDFFLPELQLWVEIKPNFSVLSKEEFSKAMEQCLHLSVQTKQRVLLYGGEINPFYQPFSFSAFPFFSVLFSSPCTGEKSSLQEVVKRFNVFWHICDKCRWVDLSSGSLESQHLNPVSSGNEECPSCRKGRLVAREDSSNRGLMSIMSSNFQRLYQAHNHAMRSTPPASISFAEDNFEESGTFNWLISEYGEDIMPDRD
jgi:hypothetical protein